MLETLIFSLALNAVGFAVAYTFRTDKLTDISYSLSFIGIAVFGIVRSDAMNAVKWLIAGAVFLWAVRLGSYLLYRIHVMGRDKRFDDKRDNLVKFGGFWLLQAITAWVVMIPTTYLLRVNGTIEPTITMYVGLAIALAGLALETAADTQKFQFIQNKANKGKWIQSGVWAYSRHPNYFGEICMWTGIFIASVSFLPSSEGWISIASPLLITVMLLFVSGIPLLEKSADAKWGKDKAYQEYKRRTSILIPLPKGK